MRKLAAYSFEANRSEQPSGFSTKGVHEAIDKWLRSKGTFSKDGAQITMNGGEVGSVERISEKSEDSILTEIIFTQPKGDGWFRTDIAIVESASATAAGVTLSAASSTLAPLMLDVRCPRVIQDFLRLPIVWRFGATRLHATPLSISDSAGVDELIGLIWRADRTVPIIVVSENNGDIVYPRIAEDLAADLAGLAVVAKLSAAASWALTEKKGRGWSCYMGAIRIYWPRITLASTPYDHPLWTRDRLLGAAADPETASERIRSQLRRRILSQSAFAVAESPIILKSRRDIRALALSTLTGKASESDDYKALAESYSEDIQRLTRDIEQRDVEIAELKEQVAGLQLALQWKQTSPDAIEPDPETPPASVEDAVRMASEKFKDTLVFGEAVWDGVSGVDREAGPPDKILTYLKALSEFTEYRRRGSLGKTAIKWLIDRGINASGESETVSNSKVERGRRTWSDGSGKKRYFDSHLKPAEATASSRCVRVYFEYDEATKKTIVGWVGRHPK